MSSVRVFKFTFSLYPQILAATFQLLKLCVDSISKEVFLIPGLQNKVSDCSFFYVWRSVEGQTVWKSDISVRIMYSCEEGLQTHRLFPFHPDHWTAATVHPVYTCSVVMTTERGKYWLQNSWTVDSNTAALFHTPTSAGYVRYVPELATNTMFSCDTNTI